MKSEERHELKSNELEKFTARVRPLFEQYGLQLLLAISAAVLVAAAAMFWTRTSAAEKTAGWTELIAATSGRTTEKLLDVADNESLSGKPVAAWARLQAAEQFLSTGIQQAFEKREGDRGLVSDLEEASKNFTAVLEVAPAKSQMRERALFGLGRCLETMAGVNQRTDADNSTPAELLEKSAKAYEELLADFPNSPYNQKRFEEEELGNLERHIQNLKSAKTKEFYAWFRTQRPTKEDRRGPFDGMPSGHPPVDSGPVTLPAIPDGLRLPNAAPDDGPELPGASTEPGEGESGDTSSADKSTDENGNLDKSASPESPSDKKDGK